MSRSQTIPDDEKNQRSKKFPRKIWHVWWKPTTGKDVYTSDNNKLKWDFRFKTMFTWKITSHSLRQNKRGREKHAILREEECLSLKIHYDHFSLRCRRGGWKMPIIEKKELIIS